MSRHDGHDSVKVERGFQGFTREFSVAGARCVSCHEVELSPNFQPFGHWSAEGPLQQAALHRHNRGVRAIVHAQFVHGGYPSIRSTRENHSRDNWMRSNRRLPCVPSCSTASCAMSAAAIAPLRIR